MTKPLDGILVVAVEQAVAPASTAQATQVAAARRVRRDTGNDGMVQRRGRRRK